MNSNIMFLKKSLRNVSYTFVAQAITLIISLIKALWIPKLLGVEEFSYWQLYIFYSSYIGFFQFGINDGIYLRYGGQSFNNLNKEVFRSQFWILVFSQFFISILLVLYSYINLSDERINILVFTCVGMVITGTSAFFWFVFQSTNRIKSYVLAIIIDKIIFLIFVIVLLILEGPSYKYYIFAELLSKVISLLYCILIGKELVIGKLASFINAMSEVIKNISVGIKLMIANIASMLILGVGRFFIDYVWGIKTFGEFSLMLSIVNMVLLFVSSVSVVLFPTLRMISKNQLTESYILMRTILILVLYFILIFFIPIKFFLSAWLPDYKDSFGYLALLLPLCIFDGKMQMLVATYLKVVRKEIILLMTNIISVILSLLLCSISALLLQDINLVIISMAAVIAIRCIIAEIFLSVELKISIKKHQISEIILIGIFISTAWYFDGVFSMVLYVLSYAFFVIYNREMIKNAIGKIRNISRNY